MSIPATAPSAPERPKRFQRFWRALVQLFHEMMGAIFGVLALAWLNSAFRAWTRDVARWLIGLAVAMALLLLYFCVTSFRRARKVC